MYLLTLLAGLQALSLAYSATAQIHELRREQNNLLAGLRALSLAYSETAQNHERRSERNKLDHSKIPKYVDSLIIPPVLHDASVERSAEVAIRQITQQILPNGYPETILWAYGNPRDSSTFSNPAWTIETIKDEPLTVTWINQLVKDPDACQNDPASDACNYLVHVLQDKYGTPIIDQTLHWANPGQATCDNGFHKTDCKGTTADPYWGPIPTTMHIHGSHVLDLSDGFPESWFLPDANDIPEGYGRYGTYYNTLTKPVDPNLETMPPGVITPSDHAQIASTVLPQGPGLEYSKQTKSIPASGGYATYNYSNDGPQATLFFHDHTLGITRLNMYAAAGGFWLVRGKHATDDLYEYDCDDNKQSLPGPPPMYGEDPNGDPVVRQKIREIPLLIQSMSFFDDGSLFYPANRLFFDGRGDGDVFADTSSYDVPFKPDSEADVSPVWNPEAFFDTWVVNGKTWPKLEVAPERYRFRILNVADSAALNLSLKVENSDEELPIYIIGGDQGYLPYVVKIRKGYFTQLTTPGGDSKEESQDSPEQALLLMPGERYDVIIDFTGLKNGAEVLMINTAPNEPFGGFEEYVAADPHTVGQVLKFVVNYDLKNPDGDQSTPATCLRLNPKVTLPEATGKRILKLVEKESEVCIADAESSGVKSVSCSKEKEPKSLGPAMAMLGYGNDQTSGSRWSDPIEMNPSLNSTEIVEVWNWTEDAHPIHFHLVHFLILGRYDIEHPEHRLSDALPWEQGFKDVAIAYPGQITKIKMHFDLPGVFVWHCHILSHEDNEMMLKFCVGDKSTNCPQDFFLSEEKRQLSVKNSSPLLRGRNSFQLSSEQFFRGHGN